jgi:hypothetical protein
MARDNNTELAEAVTRLSLAVVEGFVGVNHRLDTVIDALADLRVDHNRHLATGHGEEDS